MQCQILLLKIEANHKISGITACKEVVEERRVKGEGQLSVYDFWKGIRYMQWCVEGTTVQTPSRYPDLIVDDPCVGGKLNILMVLSMSLTPLFLKPNYIIINLYHN